MKYFHVYAKVDCGFCRKAVNLLKEEKQDFVLTILGESPEFEKATKQTFNWQTVPIVLEIDNQNGTLIGGFTELDNYIRHLKKEDRLSVRVDYEETTETTEEETNDSVPVETVEEESVDS